MNTSIIRSVIERAGHTVKRGKVEAVGTKYHEMASATAASMIALAYTTEPVAVRRSVDDRTNVWDVTCPVCLSRFTPSTTMLATQMMICPRCLSTLEADYNAEPPVVVVKHMHLE